MIDLLNLQPTFISRSLKGKYILLYGEPKIGKTTFLSQIPKVLILSFEPGVNALNNVYSQPVTSWSDFKSVIQQLKMPQLREKFEIIGIDTADVAYELCCKYICNNNGVTQLGDIPYGGGYDLAKKEFSSALNELAFLEYGMVFISHATEKKPIDSDNDNPQIAPAMANRAYGIVNKLVDIIGYIRTITNADKTQSTKIFLRGNDRFWAGSRFKYIEPVIDFTYDAVVKAIFDAIDKQIEASGVSAPQQEDKETENNAVYFKPNYDDLMMEARNLWLKITKDSENNARITLAKVDELLNTPNKNTKISEIPEDKVDVLIEIINFMKNI